MDVLERKRVHCTFLGIETDGNSLYTSYIIDRTFLIEIGKCDMPGFLIDLHWRDRCRDLLDQGKPVLSVLFICTVDEFL